LCNPHFDPGGDWDPDDLISGISPGDAAQLFACCIESEDLNFAIVNGISNHRYGRLDLESTRRLLGFEPGDGTAYSQR